MRFYYYVASTADPQAWEVHSSLQAAQNGFSTRDAALLAARQSCRRHWEDRVEPCGVRVQDAEGEWVDDLLCGEFEFETPSSL